MTYKPSTRLESVYIRKVQVQTDKNGLLVGTVALEIVGILPADCASLVRLQQPGVGGLVITLAPPRWSADEESKQLVTLSGNGRSITILAKEFEELASRAVDSGAPPEGVDLKTGEIKTAAPGKADKKKPLPA